MEIVAADIGGTHARFALAEVAHGRVVSLDKPVTLNTADHASLQTAWTAFAEHLGRPLPRAAAIAVAAPVTGGSIRLTNHAWTIDPARLDEQLGLDRHLLINDFAAIGHAVAQAAATELVHLCGPDRPLAAAGVVTICGPGTGLGVVLLQRDGGGYRVIATEGGHTAYAPLDPVEDAILTRLRTQFGRVSTERVVAGPGLLPIYQTLADLARQPATLSDAPAVWSAALADGDPLATAALDRYFRALGAVVGDLALAQGAQAVVIAGGLGYRLRDRFAGSGFAERFAAKGRFQPHMAAIPVTLIVHPQPGLFGAAAAFARQEQP